MISKIDRQEIFISGDQARTATQTPPDQELYVASDLKHRIWRRIEAISEEASFGRDLPSARITYSLYEAFRWISLVREYRIFPNYKY
jgi:hypothetical protein